MTDQGLFTSSMRENRPLSSHLRSLWEVRELVSDILGAGSLKDLEDFQGRSLTGRIASIRPKVPMLGRLVLGRIGEDEGERRDVGKGVGVQTTRYNSHRRVDGDHELLEYWPDEAEGALTTVDEGFIGEIGGLDELAGASRGEITEYWRLNSTWKLRAIGGSGEWAICTHLDVTREEERAYAKNEEMRRVFTERSERIEPIAVAISIQTERFFDDVLPAEIEALVASRASVLADRTAIVRSLDLPDEWSPEGIELEPDRRRNDVEELADQSESVADPGASSGVEDLQISDMQYKLSAKSFSEVLRTVRTWADAVERNPRGFSHLDEDAISDLLAATLNATVPYAGREVFSRSGKTDIYLEADVLSAGLGPARVFLCESKWATARARVLEALEKQIFRYATAHTTSALLLALCSQKDFEAGRRSVIDWSRQAQGWSDGVVLPEVVREWPMQAYQVEGRRIEVCIATVSVPAVTTRSGKPK